MKLDLSKPVQTRDGRKVELLAMDMGTARPVLWRVQYSISPLLWTTIYTYPDGSTNGSMSSPDDIINIPEKKVLDVWVNVYPNGISYVYKTRDEANGNASYARLACIHLQQEYTVGEGL